MLDDCLVSVSKSQNFLTTDVKKTQTLQIWEAVIEPIKYNLEISSLGSQFLGFFFKLILDRGLSVYIEL